MRLVEPRAEADQDLRADDVEDALEQVEPDRQHRERQQCRNAAAGQRPIVDLQHVERAGQRQNVDDAGDDEQEDEDAAKSLRQLLRRVLRLLPVDGALVTHVRAPFLADAGDMERAGRAGPPAAAPALEVEVRSGQVVVALDARCVNSASAVAVDVALHDRVVAVGTRLVGDHQLRRAA